MNISYNCQSNLGEGKEEWALCQCSIWEVVIFVKGSMMFRYIKGIRFVFGIWGLVYLQNSFFPLGFLVC